MMPFRKLSPRSPKGRRSRTILRCWCSSFGAPGTCCDTSRPSDLTLRFDAVVFVVLRVVVIVVVVVAAVRADIVEHDPYGIGPQPDRKSTRLNSSHRCIS